jgi:ectoine hydroxylase-related dioxygenase (phytanoyl-CoA dioxygenase family)
MLDRDQIDAFFERGFLVLPGVFGAGEVTEMRSAFDRLEREAQALGQSGMHRGAQFVLGRGPDPSRVRIDRIVWCGAAEPVLARFGADPRLVEPAAQLLGSDEMSQLINQAHFKLPGDGVEFPWHQDSTHRRYGGGEWTDVNGRGSYVQTITAVDAVTADNGPLELVPGSARLGHVEPGPDRAGQLPPELAGAEVVAPTMEAGSVLVFGPYTFHRSLPNRSERPRRVFINGYASPGANRRVYPGEGAGRLLSVRRGAA